MGIANRIFMRDDIENALPEELTRLSRKIANAYNPMTDADMPFIAAILKMQADGMLAIMQEDKAAMKCYENILALCKTVSFKIPKIDKGGNGDGI